jgi:hypothetical protein
VEIASASRESYKLFLFNNYPIVSDKSQSIVDNIIEEFIQIKSSFLTDKRFGES